MVNPIVDEVAGPVAAFAAAIIDRIFPDKEADAERRSALMLQAQSIDAQMAQAQIAVNQAEAQSASLFVSGGRPFIMWVCGFAFAYHLILQPLLAFAMAAYGHNFPMPEFDSATLNTTLMGLLGLGGLRTWERIQGVDNKRIG